MKLRILLLVGIFFLGMVCAYAQGGPGGGLDNENPSETSTAVPIDGGLSLLLGAGVALGVKKGYDYRRKKQGESKK